MSIKNYWPSRENVSACIHSEAEVLSDALLLSVHSPMRLEAISFNERNKNNPVEKTEVDLLNYVLTNNGPFPVVGSSGSGKSHIIRWLHAKLKQQGLDRSWHIVRIPKNATMVQVLTLLLDGLEGEEFEKARQDIQSVGSELSQDLIQRLFFTYLEEACNVLAKKYKGLSKTEREEGEDVLAKELKSKSTIAKHLGVCFSDRTFQRFLSGDNKPVTNTIERLSRSKSYSEVTDAVYQVQVCDINISANIGFELDDLNVGARRAFEALRFFTDDDIENNERAQLAVEIINQAINDTGKLVFNNLFKFNSGSFPDLFISVRKALKTQGRTLVILIEDLAAISAIDNVLLDSLIQEDTYAGENNLCDLKSVIATTSGQATYRERQESIHSRAGDEQLEWRIPTVQERLSHKDDEDLLIDFCGRYLNAARLGIDQINAHYTNQGINIPIWLTTEELSETDAKALEDFGASSHGIPLFPLSRTAIINLAKLKQQGNKNFNPRVVIKELLIPILRDNQADFVNDDYPASNFTAKFESRVPDSIREWSRKHYVADEIVRRRLDNFLTIYASTLGTRQPFDEIKQSITCSQADVFNLPSDKFGEHSSETKRCSNCSELIEQCTCNKVENCTKCARPKQECICEVPLESKCTGCGRSQSECVCDETYELEVKIDDWFNGDSRLDANTSHIIRKHLFGVLYDDATLSQYGVISTNKWSGNKSLFDIALKSGPRLNILIPKSVASIDLEVVTLCKEEQLNDSDAGFQLKKQILAIVRYDYYVQKNLGWNYAKGFEDYGYYMEFMATWIPSAIQDCLTHVRSETPKLLAKQKALALALGINKPKKELLDLFVQRSEHIADTLPAPINDDFAALQSELLKEWDNTRGEWMMRISYSPSAGGSEVGIDAPLYSEYFKASDAIPAESFTPAQRTLYRRAKSEVSVRLNRFVNDVSEIENSNDAKTQFDILEQVYSNIKTDMMPDSTTTRKAKNKLNKLRDMYEWSLIENARKFVASTDESQQLQALYKIDGEQLSQWLLVLDEFAIVERHALPRLQRSNEELGGQRMNEFRGNIENYLSDIESAVRELDARKETIDEL
ncbi:protein DpdH [Vibrio cyclitrophicus]